MAAPKVSTTFNAVDRMSKPLRGMRKSVTGFSRHTQRSFGGVAQTFSRMRGLLVGAGAAMTTGAIARGISSFADAGDDIAKTARQLGIGVEALQELRFAGEKFGVEQEALRDGMKELSLRADEFAVTAAGPAAEAFERLGLSQERINRNKGDTEALFEMVRRELSRVEDVAARQRIADEIFGGTGGEQMVEMASASTEELAKFRKEARETGGVMSGESAAAAEKFNRSMQQLRGVAVGLRNRALTPLIKDLTPLIKQTSAWISENKELISLKIRETFQNIAKSVRVLVRLWESGLIPAIIAGVLAFKTLSGAVAVVKTLQAAWVAFNVVFAATPVGAIIAGIAALAGLFVLLWKRSERFRNTIKNIWETIKTIATAGPRLLGRLGDVLGFGDRQGSTGGGMAGVSGGQTTPMGAGASVSRSVTENRSSVDINLPNVPDGTQVRQRGQAPGVSLNVGAGGTL